MKKLLAIFGCLTVALALGGFTFTNTTTYEFTKGDGTTVTVIGSNPTFTEGEACDIQDNVKIGDTIQNPDGVDEIVFAIAENGAYITMPVE